MGKVIPITAVRTTERWLLDNGFQKLEGPGIELFKKDELYIEHSHYREMGNWYRVIPGPGGGSSLVYSGIPQVSGYAADFTYLVEELYAHVMGRSLMQKAN